MHHIKILTCVVLYKFISLWQGTPKLSSALLEQYVFILSAFVKYVNIRFSHSPSDSGSRKISLWLKENKY